MKEEREGVSGGYWPIMMWLGRAGTHHCWCQWWRLNALGGKGWGCEVAGGYLPIMLWPVGAGTHCLLVLVMMVDCFRKVEDVRLLVVVGPWWCHQEELALGGGGGLIIRGQEFDNKRTGMDVRSYCLVTCTEKYFVNRIAYSILKLNVFCLHAKHYIFCFHCKVSQSIN